MDLVAVLAAGAFLLALNAFFVLAEFAIVKVRASRITELVHAGHPRAQLLQSIHARLDEYLSVCQVGITLASVALGMVGERGAELLGAGDGSTTSYVVAIVFSYLVVSGSHIVLGELVPKSIAIRVADRAALWAALPLRGFHWLFFLPLWVLNRIAAVFLRLLGFPGQASENEHSEDELRIILDHSQSRGLLSFRRLLFIENVFDLGDLRVKDAMRPRSQVKTLQVGQDQEAVHATIRACRFSRYPLLGEDGEQPLGIIHLKDLLLRDGNSGAFSLRALMRPYLEVTESAPLEQTLADMQRRRLRMALVRNDAGHWIGLLSLEDVLEEIVGTITDEFERDEPVRLADALAEERVVIGLTAGSLMEAIPSILARIPAPALPLTVDKITKAVLERERTSGTYLGRGIAMPHARLPGLERPVLIVANAPVGIPTASGERAYLIFMLLTPAGSPRLHQRLQATIISLLENSDYIDERLRDATTAPQIIEALIAGEQAALG